MGIKTYNPYTPSRRQMTGSDFSEITKKTPEKSLLAPRSRQAGRNNQGKITVRHRGGGAKRKYRIVDFTQMIFPGIITMICIGLFAMVVSAISMCVCSLAKSFKDAQNYITPVMLIIMIPSYVSMIPNIELDGFTSTIPVVNISLLIKSVLSFKFDLNLIAIVFVSNFAFMILSVLLLSKMFNSEEILFGNNRSFSFLEKRSNIKKGTMPTISDGAILYAVGLVLLIYVGSLVQLKFKMAGLAMTQVMIISLSLRFSCFYSLISGY